ncbi:MAG: hypothetical protein V3R72_08565, partial [Gammaproteobacteria bacterium]
VRPDFWFFDAHFLEDPVWPGSLGLEAFLQLMKVAANERWRLTPTARFATMPTGAVRDYAHGRATQMGVPRPSRPDL